MYSIKNLLGQEPVVISGVLLAILNALSLFGVITVDVDQLAGVNVATVGILTLLTRSKVTPV